MFTYLPALHTTLSSTVQTMQYALKCTALSQSLSSNFYTYIIIYYTSLVHNSIIVDISLISYRPQAQLIILYYNTILVHDSIIVDISYIANIFLRPVLS